MAHKILFVEDNYHKRQGIVGFLRTNFAFLEIFEAQSFSSGCQALEREVYSMVILDMSLPTYDRVGSESGGRFRPFAGREIARKLIKSGATSKILFVTQYSSFSDRGTSYSFDDLKLDLAQVCGNNFSGMIFYDSSMSSWKNQISDVIKALA